MLKIEIIKKSFNKKLLIKDLTTSIKKGEFVSIIGPSGCGKTTLLNMIAEVDKNFQGEILKEENSLSFMFQDDRLLPWLSIKENLLLVSKTKDLKEIQNLLALTHLEEVLEKYPKSLSGGMKRRVSLARAFINSPKLILLDEPFISLDYPTATTLKKEFVNLSKTFSPTTILVTHDLSEAIALSDRIIFLKSEPTEIILDYQNSNKQSFNTEKVDEIKNAILQKHPKILEGVV